MEIPPGVRALLWDVSDDVDPGDEMLEALIIERVMARGCWDDMQWLLRTFDRVRLLEFIENRGRQVLPARELNFWSGVCGAAHEERHAWVREARERERAWRG